jgi:hypothetical protein
VTDARRVPPGSNPEHDASLPPSFWGAIVCGVLGVAIGEALVNGPAQDIALAGRALRWWAILGASRWASRVFQKRSLAEGPASQLPPNVSRRLGSKERLNAKPDSYSVFFALVLALTTFAAILHTACGSLQ